MKRQTKEKIMLSEGQQLENYQIIKVLDIGGSQITYLAMDLSLNNKVAIQEFFPRSVVCRSTDGTTVTIREGVQASEYNEILTRFISVFIKLRRLPKHPNIINITGFFRANNTAYTVMDLIEGETLCQKLEKLQRPLTEDEIRQYAIPLLHALNTLHHKQPDGSYFIHGDINPSSIIIGHDDQPKLIDIKNAIHTADNNTPAKFVPIRGGYSAEEQYSGEVTAASDLYAFGMLLYKLMAPKETLPDAMDRHGAYIESFYNEIWDPLKPIREVAQGYSDGLYRLVEFCTRLSMCDRPVNVSQLLDTFDAYDKQGKQINESPAKEDEKKAEPGDMVIKVFVIFMLIVFFGLKLAEKYNQESKRQVVDAQLKKELSAADEQRKILRQEMDEVMKPIEKMLDQALDEEIEKQFQNSEQMRKTLFKTGEQDSDWFNKGGDFLNNVFAEGVNTYATSDGAIDIYGREITEKDLPEGYRFYQKVALDSQSQADEMNGHYMSEILFEETQNGEKFVLVINQKVKQKGNAMCGITKPSINLLVKARPDYEGQLMQALVQKMVNQAPLTCDLPIGQSDKFTLKSYLPDGHFLPNASSLDDVYRYDPNRVMTNEALARLLSGEHA